MKLVLHHTYVNEPDCITYDIPFEYESVEKAEYDFLELCEKAIGNYNSVSFCGSEYYSHHFYCNGEYYGPDIYTLEDWWERFRAKEF